MASVMLSCSYMLCVNEGCNRVPICCRAGSATHGGRGGRGEARRLSAASGAPTRGGRPDWVCGLSGSGAAEKQSTTAVQWQEECAATGNHSLHDSLQQLGTSCMCLRWHFDVAGSFVPVGTDARPAAWLCCRVPYSVCCHVVTPEPNSTACKQHQHAMP